MKLRDNLETIENNTILFLRMLSNIEIWDCLKKILPIKENKIIFWIKFSYKIGCNLRLQPYSIK